MFFKSSLYSSAYGFVCADIVSVAYVTVIPFGFVTDYVALICYITLMLIANGTINAYAYEFI